MSLLSLPRFLAMLACAGAFIGANAYAQAESSQTPRGAGQAVVYLIQIGDFPLDATDKLAAYIQQRFKLQVTKLPRMSLTKQMIDYARRQVPANEIFDALEPKRLRLLKESKGLIIGLTTYDMYIRGIDWPFVFAAREAPALAAVSSWRMDELNEGKRANNELMLARLKKMVAKNVGIMLLGYEESQDPKSGMFGPVMNVEQLDAMGEEF